MVLSKKQEEGLRVAVARYKNNEKYTCIAGFAGTGKSTLIKFIVAALGVNPEEDVCYAAFTGKAATVLSEKGCPNAITAHKLLYHARPMPDGTYRFVKKNSIDYKIVIIDEVSMLPMSMWKILLNYPNIYIIATGDPFQLPTINPEEDNHVLDNPHIFLDEIMRQAYDSEIIRLSMWIREGKTLKTFDGKGEQVKIFSPKEAVSGMYTWADQILCATNDTRKKINDFMREQKGYGIEPCIGDKIISLNNHWEALSWNNFAPLTNGTIGTITDYRVEAKRVPPWVSRDKIDVMYTSFNIGDNDFFLDTAIDYKALKTGTPALNPKQTYLLNKAAKSNPTNISAPFDFTYAYAITTHKAQGSQWDKVLVVEEGFPYKEEHARWLYTAITRASEKAVIISKD